MPVATAELQTCTDPAVTVHAAPLSFPFASYVMHFLFQIFTPYPNFLKSVGIFFFIVLKKYKQSFISFPVGCLSSVFT